jgi:hypothetical protein
VFAALILEGLEFGLGEIHRLDRGFRTAFAEVFDLADAVDSQPGVAGDVEPGGQPAIDQQAEEPFLSVDGGGYDAVELFELGTELVVQIAWGDKENGTFDLDGSIRIRNGFKSAFEEGPYDSGERLAQAGVVRENEAVGHGGGGVVMKLKTFKSHWKEFRRQKSKKQNLESNQNLLVR